MVGREVAKWKEAIDIEIQYDNQLWTLVDQMSGQKTVGNKWIFKKNNNMDGNV